MRDDHGTDGRVASATAGAADMDELDAALGGLRAAGWPAPEDPDGDDDAGAGQAAT
jgi:hypothetical protein